MIALVAAQIDLSQYTLPPVRFRSDNTVVVTFAKPELVQELCGQHHNPELIGCANILPPSMVVPNPCVFPEQSYARTLCHELGHSLGWAATHGD